MFEKEEVRGAIELLKREKAAGHDGIKQEMIKGLGSKRAEILTNLLNRVGPVARRKDTKGLGTADFATDI